MTWTRGFASSTRFRRTRRNPQRKLVCGQIARRRVAQSTMGSIRWPSDRASRVLQAGSEGLREGGPGFNRPLLVAVDSFKRLLANLPWAPAPGPFFVRRQRIVTIKGNGIVARTGRSLPSDRGFVPYTHGSIILYGNLK